MGKKIFIMTCVHEWNDNRILFKEASSLARNYTVELHAPGNFKLKELNGVRIFGLTPVRRLLRPLSWFRLFFRAVKAKASVYHFHDPELIPLGLFLRILGKKVVYDVHEDYPDAILYKQWIPKPLRKMTSFIFNFLEKKCSSFFSGLIFAELTYKESFRNSRTPQIDILNYPLDCEPKERVLKEADQCCNLIYAGTVGEIRGAVEMLKAMAILADRGGNVHLFLVGPFPCPSLRAELEEFLNGHGLLEYVTITGRVAPAKVYSYYKKADIGLCLLHPVENNLKSLVTKLFEYMSAGIPILASNFPRWSRLLEETGTGLTANPLDPDDIARQICTLVDNPELRLSMGFSGREAYEKSFNWRVEETKLISFYDKLLEG
ncbi:MAG TPA: hypothetical protein DCK76_07985 [Desulfotomaculum sp.]|nr:MAG: Glycosyl transferase group 1 [Desulfotomaculum sp. 46_80]HAG11308.1 hypothetical protein [Desulfotomaculum sp.]HBY03544.1 hypothetical protein [Desulfotomaculum sp.]